MKIIIHRGSHQIGGTIIELATKNTRIILDAGEVLPSIDEVTKVDSVEEISLKGLFKGDKKGVDGVFISHGHGDHIGMISYLNEEIPIFMGEKTADIYNMTGKFIGRKSFIKSTIFLEHEKPILIGDFVIIPYLVDHSAYDSYAFIIYGEGKSAIYTGDIREHGNKARLTSYFRSKIPVNADVLLMEGTMLGRQDEKIETENEISNRAEIIMTETEKPVFVMQSATNIDRLVAMYNGAKESGRIFVIDIFTANIIETVGGSVSNILRKSRIIYPKQLTQRMYDCGENELMNKFAHKKIKIDELNGINNYCMLIRSSMLSILENLKGIDGSTLIYSMWRGYEEREDVKRILDFARSKNVEIKYLHTSGHAGIKTLQNIVSSCSPKRIVPIHTEHPEGYKELFQNVHLIKDGEWIKI